MSESSDKKKKPAVEESPHKYIIIRTISGRIQEMLEQYDDLRSQGYTYKLQGKDGFKSSNNRIKGMLAKPEDIEFLKGQATEQAKREAGISLANCNLKEHYVLVLPYGIEFPWKKELSNLSRNKKSILETLKGYNLGMAIDDEIPSCGVAPWLQSLRERHVGLFTRYFTDLQAPTDEDRILAEELKQLHEEVKVENIKEGIAKSKAKKKQTDKDINKTEDNKETK
jgi:hypothetical protein